MSAAGPMHHPAKPLDLPRAHIDAQDETYILPLREYLESYGVNVLVNESGDAVPTYHIVVGDAAFVKHIFYRTEEVGVKRLGIVLDDQGAGMETDGSFKLIFVRPAPLTKEEVFAIFKFYFSDDKHSLDLRKNRETRTVHEIALGKPRAAGHMRDTNRDQVPGDKARINTILADVYGASELKRYQHSPKRSSFAKRMLFGVIIAAGLIIVPIFWYALSLMISSVSVFSGARSLASGDMTMTEWDAQIADYWLSQGEVIVHTASIIFSWVDLEDAVRGQERLMSFIQDAADAERDVRSMSGTGLKVASGFLNQIDVTGTGTTSVADIVTLRTDLATAQTTLGLAQAELVQLISDQTFPFSIGFIQTRAERTVSELATLRTASEDMDHVLSLFLQVAGFRGTKTYLILLQNSAELRPTGGFIGSVAIASFSDGRLTNLDVQDVYTFDGQLKGHVDPPSPIRDLLGEEHWYLRDSNWDPDFLEAGQRAAWFYEKETGTTVDGVFAVSSPFMTKVLAATGPVDLPDYNDRITSDNFYGKSLYYTQNNFFPGSTQKKDFLGSLMRALLTKVTSAKGVNVTKLFRALTTSLTAHDIMMTFSDADLQAVAEHYGWAGRVPATNGCIGVDTRMCTFDPIIVNEANLGINKANVLVSRSMTRRIVLNADGTRNETVTVKLHNATDEKQSPLPYQVYLRVLFPPTSDVAGVTIDGVQVPTHQASSTASLTLPYTEKTSVASGIYALGTAFDVPPGKDSIFTVTYSVTTPIQFGLNGATLDVYIPKQPGVDGTPVETTVQYPNTWTAGLDEEAGRGTVDFIAKQGQLEYNTILTRDDLTRIRFTK